jgi:hypothetical protein
MKTFRHNADGSGDIVEVTVVPGPYSTSPEVTEETVLVHVTAEDLVHWQSVSSLEPTVPPPPPAAEPVPDVVEHAPAAAEPTETPHA